ncbi:MAG: VOC family protein [Rhodospirillaceae bacterium]|nr:VOC family protein [Rhodospirillaceae bacterium]
MNFGLHHVALSTPDLDRCLDFYCNVIGAVPASPELSWEAGNEDSDRSLQVNGSAARFAHIRVGKAFMEIFEFRTPAPAELPRRSIDFGIAHLCFQVDDLDAEYQRMKELGMRFHSEPVRFGDGSKYVYGRDIDDNIIELLEIPATARTPNNYPDA